MHKPIWILNRNSTIIIASAIVNSKNIFKLKLPHHEFEIILAKNLLASTEIYAGNKICYNVKKIILEK